MNHPHISRAPLRPRPDPAIIRLAKALARRAAREDHEAALRQGDKARNEGGET